MLSGSNYVDFFLFFFTNHLLSTAQLHNYFSFSLMVENFRKKMVQNCMSDPEQ